MELNVLRQHHQLALARQGKAGNDEERRAFCQFVRDYSVQIEATRPQSGAADVVIGFRK